MLRTNSFFVGVPRIPADAIFALTASYNKDPSPLKVNLGQGTYRDENGQPWILPSVAASRERLSKEGLLHEYLPILGLQSFREAAAKMVLGSEIFKSKQQNIASCQSISGTGALHLAGLFLRRCNLADSQVHVPEPSWSNHIQVFSSLGFDTRTFNYYDAKRKSLDFDSYINAIRSMEAGSIIILHACAHNPTGCDPSKEQWQMIGQVVKERGLFPLFDSAYLGFNSGDVDNDAYAIRYFINELDLECGICVSFAKNMGLYGERVGCTMIITKDAETAINSQSVLETLQRSEVSNPPAYGAKIASQILNDPSLNQMWRQDLQTMSGRIRLMRQMLYDTLVASGAPGNWDHILKQSGMFGFLGLPRDIVLELKDSYHIYMAENSRVSIAGLNQSNVQYVGESIATCLKQRASSGSEIEARL